MDIKKLQKLVVDALEDVKAQDIQLFDTMHLTSMFDRIAIASGTSNRQTRALAASVRDKVKAAGGKIVSIEGENTGEWVLVDLGDMVVHIMQPTIRAYYRLEELWGDKPVKQTVSKRAVKPSATGTRKAATTNTKVAKPASDKSSDEVPKKRAPRKTSATSEETSITAKKSPVKKVSATKKPAAKTATASKTPAKKATKTAAGTAVKTPAKRSSPRKPKAEE